MMKTQNSPIQENLNIGWTENQSKGFSESSRTEGKKFADFSSLNYSVNRECSFRKYSETMRAPCDHG